MWAKTEFNVHEPTRTVVASGSAVGSGSMRARRLPSGVSLSVSLIRDPLRPTKETPAMTTISETHLDGRCQLVTDGG